MQINGSFVTAPKVMTARVVLCIAPRPGDIEMAMGALVKKYTDEGVHVEYLIMTDGGLESLNRTLTEEQIIKMRKDEVENSAKFLGVKKVRYLNYKDRTMTDVAKASEEIAEIIRTVKPDVVFSPDPYNQYESDLDFIVTGKAASNAFMNAALNNYPRGTKTKPYGPKVMAYYNSAKPNQFIDIAENFDDQIASIAMHKSQIDDIMIKMYKGIIRNNYAQYATALKKEMVAPVKALGRIHLHNFVKVDLIK